MWVQDFLRPQPQAKTLKTHLIANNMFLKFWQYEFYQPEDARQGIVTRFCRLLTTLLAFACVVLMLTTTTSTAFGTACDRRSMCRKGCIEDVFPQMTCMQNGTTVDFGGNVYSNVFEYAPPAGEDPSEAFLACRDAISPLMGLSEALTMEEDGRLDKTETCFPPCRNAADRRLSMLVGAEDNRPECGPEHNLADLRSILCVSPAETCEQVIYYDEVCFYQNLATGYDYCMSPNMLLMATLFGVPVLTVVDVLFVQTAAIQIANIQEFKASAIKCGLQWIIVFLFIAVVVMFLALLFDNLEHGRPQLFAVTFVLALIIDQVRNVIAQTLIWYVGIRRFGQVPLMDESVYVYDVEPGPFDFVTAIMTKIYNSKPFEIGTVILMFVFLFHVLAWSALEGEAFFSDTADRIFEYADTLILILFTIEILIRAVAEGPQYFRSFFNFADSIIILACIVMKFTNTQSGGVAMLRLLRLLRVFLIMQRSGDKKRLRRKKGKGVTFSSPSERVLETLREIKDNTKGLTLAMREKIEWVAEVISAKKLDQVVVDMGSKPDGIAVDHEAGELQKLASNTGADGSSAAANELENFLMGRQKRKAVDDGSKHLEELIREVPGETRAQAETYIFANGDSWQMFDIFELRELCAPENCGVLSENKDARDTPVDLESNQYTFDEEQVSMLPLLVLYAFKSHDVYSVFDVSPAALVEFARRMEAGYPARNPYHNPIHVVEVVQAASVMLGWCAKIQRGNQAVLNPQDKLCLIFAGMMIDYEHPGFTNQFLVSVHHPMAILYNDLYVLEQHHVSAAFMSMFNLEHDPLQTVSEDQFQQIRRCIIKAVLATDLTTHFNETLPVFKTKMSGKDFPSVKAEDKQIVLNILLHAADFSRHARFADCCMRWTVRYMEEAFRQGDEEVKHKLPISRFFDRSTSFIPKVQIGFIEGFVLPTYELIAQIAPEVEEEILPLLHAAKSKYHTVVAEAARRAGRVDMAEQHAEQAGRKSGAAGKNQKKGLAGKLQRSLSTRLTAAGGNKRGSVMTMMGMGAKSPRSGSKEPKVGQAGQAQP